MVSISISVLDGWAGVILYGRGEARYKDPRVRTLAWIEHPGASSSVYI